MTLPENVIPACFSPEFRSDIAAYIKRFGHRAAEKQLSGQAHPAFVRALIRSIIRKEGW